MFLIYSSGVATAGHLGLKFNNSLFLILFLPFFPVFLSFTIKLYFNENLNDINLKEGDIIE
jgi:hypothetical protein